ncbi:MAG TPA: BON domain-containing protein [Burkholderiaceae bacterium]|jgi:hyperosmotically inducible protein
MKIKNKFGLIEVILVTTLLAIVSGCNRQADDSNASPANAPTVGMQVDDTIVTSKVKSALLADPDIKSSDIKVETNKGEVMLSGFADSQDQINRSIEAARRVEGVKGVDNKLALKNGPSTVGNKIDDGVITAKVKAALLGAEDLKSMDISVATNKGDVQLSGFVDNDNQIARAAEVAKNVEGVTSVTNQLSVKK